MVLKLTDLIIQRQPLSNTFKEGHTVHSGHYNMGKAGERGDIVNIEPPVDVWS